MSAETQRLHDHQTAYIAQKKKGSALFLKNISGIKEMNEFQAFNKLQHCSVLQTIINVYIGIHRI